MVTIKNFSMPHNCYDCDLHNYHECDLTNESIEEDYCWNGDSREKHCPLREIEAIPKADYEARLKADMVAMLTEIQMEIEECVDGAEGSAQFEQGVDIARNQVIDITQEKISKLKENAEYKEPTTKNDLGVDCVARQDVERYIEGFINEYTPKEELEFINLELDGLKHLPSVTPQKPKWIPVSERLPEPYMFVNATCRSLVDDREDWVVETIYLPIPKEANKHGYSDWGNIPILNWGEAEVIAWVERVIPQPYKADRSEEQTGENT